MAPVPDGNGLRWSGAQQAMLRELGCELFVMRGAASPLPATVQGEPVEPPATRPAPRTVQGEPVESPAVPVTPTRTPAAPSRAPRGGGTARARLVMLAPDAALLRGPQAGLARALLAALGVHEAEVRGEPTPGVPAIVFGDAIADAGDALRAPALSALRDARAKRALWPALRVLRRRLRDTAGA